MIGLGLSLTGQRTSASLASLLFGMNEPGFTFEPWDITTLYQDRAGTTPVTAAGQSVGLRLSKDQGLRQGPELVTNGTFGANITGWSNTGSSTSIWESGAARWSTATADFSGFRSASFATVVGRTYEFTATVLENTGAAWRIILVNGDGSYSNGTDNYTTPGTRTARFIATQTTSFVEIRNGTAATANRLIDNISVRELAGNHEVAVSDAKRGIYGWMPKTGRRNLLTYTEQFDTVWSKVQTTVSSNTVAAPDGTTTGDSILDIAVSNIHYCAQDITPLAPSGKTYTVSAYAKASTLNYMTLGLSDISSGTLYAVAVFNLSNGTVSTSGAAGTGYSVVSSSVLSAENGWYRCIVTVVVGASASFLRSVVAPNKTGVITASAGGFESYLGDGSSFYAWGAQLEVGSTATAYQRVASQYDITEAGVPTCYYVQADGVDDAYVTPTITPNTDKAQVFAGVRKLSNSTGIILETGFNSGSSGAFYFATDTTPSDNFAYSGRGARAGLAADTANASSVAPAFAVLTAQQDINSGNPSTIRKDGSLAASSISTTFGGGNFLAYPAYIYSRGGTSFPFNGLDFGHAVRFGPNLDAATIARVEALIARNTPEVTL